MNNEQKICQIESKIVKAAKSKNISGEIEAHLESCTDCRTAVELVRFFEAGQAAEPVSPRLPSPGLIWWKSGLRKKQMAAEKIAKPMLAAHIFAFCILIVLVGLIIFLQPPLIVSLGSTMAGVFGILGPIIIPVGLGVFLFGLFCYALLNLSNRLFTAGEKAGGDR